MTIGALSIAVRRQQEQQEQLDPIKKDDKTKGDMSKDKGSARMKKDCRTKKANTQKDDTSPDKPY